MLQCTIVFAFCILCVTSLRIEDVAEGNCRGLRLQPVPATNVDLASMTSSFKYVPAASRYKHYVFASGHPHFGKMGDSDLRDNLCTTHNGSDPSGRGTAFGFGGHILGAYIFTPKPGQPAVFDCLYIPSNGADAFAVRSTQTITLTDYKTFAFFVGCYTNGPFEQKEWGVLAPTPNLGVSTWQIIENHALSLGFSRDNFLFLNYDACDDNSNQMGSGGYPERHFTRVGYFAWGEFF